MTNKRTYQQPLIEQVEVQVERGIATSDSTFDNYNHITDMENGSAWGEYVE